MNLNPFKKKMKNITFLTQSEITELKQIRANNINDNEFQPFVIFLKKNGEKFSLMARENRISVFKIAKEFFLKNVAYKAGYELYTQKI
ncbi:MAG TPA: hypothetical protein VGK38_10740, partial [Prolixibacteraceae bacterium]